MEDTQPEAAVGDSVSDQRDESSNTEPSAFEPGSSVQQSSTHHTQFESERHSFSATDCCCLLIARQP